MRIFFFQCKDCLFYEPIIIHLRNSFHGIIGSKVLVNWLHHRFPSILVLGVFCFGVSLSGALSWSQFFAVVRHYLCDFIKKKKYNIYTHLKTLNLSKWWLLQRCSPWNDLVQLSQMGFYMYIHDYFKIYIYIFDKLKSLYFMLQKLMQKIYM